MENTRSQACTSNGNPQSASRAPAKHSGTRKTVQQWPLSRLPESSDQVERAPKVQSPASTIRNTRRTSSASRHETTLPLRGFPVCLSNSPADRSMRSASLPAFAQAEGLLRIAGRKAAPFAWRLSCLQGVWGKGSLQAEGAAGGRELVFKGLAPPGRTSRRLAALGSARGHDSRLSGPRYKRRGSESPVSRQNRPLGAETP